MNVRHYKSLRKHHLPMHFVCNQLPRFHSTVYPSVAWNNFPRSTTHEDPNRKCLYLSPEGRAFIRLSSQKSQSISILLLLQQHVVDLQRKWIR